MKLRKSLWLFLVLTLVMSLFLAACSGGEKAGTDTEKEETPKEETPKEEPKNTDPVTGGDLVIGSAGSPTLFNPYFSTDTASSDIEGLIYNALVKTNKNLETELDLAEKIDVSDDGLVYTVKLREGVKWHDGEEMNADDLVFAYSMMKNPDVVSERKSNFESLEKIEKIDDYTVKFTLNKVDVTFYPTTLGSYGPLPEHILGDVDPATLHENEFNTKNPIGTGPFKFVEWKDGEYVKVEANEDYFEGRPYLDTITTKYVADANALIAALQAGEIDMYNAFPGTEIDTVKAIDGVKIEEDLALSYTFLAFNQQDKRFQDKKVRQAFTHAVNKEAIVESIMNGAGQPADAPDSPLMWTYNDDVPKFEYDLEKAKQLLEEAGWKDTNGNGIVDKDGEEMSFSIKTNQGNKVREDIAVVLQQQFKEIGVEAKPEIVEWSAFIEAISAPNWDYEAMILGWSLSTFPDQYDIFHSSQAAEGLNFVWYKNEEADKLMEEARQTTDRDRYVEIHKDLYQILVEDQAYTFLYYPIEYRAMPEELQGYEFHAKNQLFNAHKWWLQTAE